MAEHSTSTAINELDKKIICALQGDFPLVAEPYKVLAEKVGISEMDTIVAATSNGAKVLRVYDKTGSLEAGKSADLLVINGNPLENIRAIDVENMEVIMKEGEFIKG